MGTSILSMPEPTYEMDPPWACCTRPPGRIADIDQLNPSQLEAIACSDKRLLIIAGAGSGKTRTLIFRLAHLVENGISPHSILLLSFTRKAAREMISRAASLTDHRCQQVLGSTFHSFAYSILQQQAHIIGIPNNFSVLDRSDSEDLINLVLGQWASEQLAHHLPRKSTLATIFSKSLNKGLPIEDIVYEDYPHLGHQVEVIYKIWEAYRMKKREHLYMDFDDLLINLKQLLADSEIVRELLHSRFRYILVDEYQDTNPIQADIISLMLGPDQRLMVVGDDAQSIYAFRGADFRNILSFPDRFPGTRVITLEQNYRSLQPILELANALIDQAAQKYEKHLFTQRPGGGVPQLVAAANEHIQSHYICQEILRRHDQGIAYKEMAVLFRSGYLAFDLEMELTRYHVPFVKYGGFKFSESSHIKDMLAHLKIFVSPQDRLSWFRILKLIPKIGPKTAQTIYEAVHRQKKGAASLLSLSTEIPTMEALAPLKELIATTDLNLMSVSGLGERVLSYYQPYLEEHYDDHPRRRRDLEQLVSIMDRYDRLDSFLADMKIEPPDAGIKGQLAAASDSSDRLVLSTIHSAKGLEWRIVFIIWVLDGRFPSHHALNRMDDLEEERRLMYVAVTRAQDDIILSYPVQVYDRASGTLLYQPSRFLEGIDEKLMEKRFLRSEDI